MQTSNISDDRNVNFVVPLANPINIFCLLFFK